MTDTSPLRLATLLETLSYEVMMSEVLGLEFEQMLAEARAGDAAARGQLLSHYTHYLNLLARLNLGRGLQAKLNHSDIVQDAFLEAEKNFAAYRGTTEQELMAWLRQILAIQIAQEVRFHHRQRRMSLWNAGSWKTSIGRRPVWEFS